MECSFRRCTVNLYQNDLIYPTNGLNERYIVYGNDFSLKEAVGPGDLTSHSLFFHKRNIWNVQLIIINVQLKLKSQLILLTGVTQIVNWYRYLNCNNHTIEYVSIHSWMLFSF